MQVLTTRAELRSALAGVSTTVLVPTMGSLHDGHLSLLEIARNRGAPVVASIFVNRLQFAPHEDFASYPRTLQRDCELLSNAGCDIVFAPDEKEMYPEIQECKVHPPERLGNILEGEVRPGFFVGVCTVVMKLFGMVQPAVAVFGKKDYQQLRVIENMVRQLGLPIEIAPGETVRASGGLALSSRNAYLSERERVEAAALNDTLREMVAAIEAGRTDWRALEREAMTRLAARKWQVDYMAIRSQRDLAPPTSGDPLVALGAARLGQTRLIDNLEIT